VFFVRGSAFHRCRIVPQHNTQHVNCCGCLRRDRRCRLRLHGGVTAFATPPTRFRFVAPAMLHLLGALTTGHVPASSQAIEPAVSGSARPCTSPSAASGSAPSMQATSTPHAACRSITDVATVELLGRVLGHASRSTYIVQRVGEFAIGVDKLGAASPPLTRSCLCVVRCSRSFGRGCHPAFTQARDNWQPRAVSTRLSGGGRSRARPALHEVYALRTATQHCMAG